MLRIISFVLALASTVGITTARGQHHYSDAERRIITLVDEGRAADSVAMFLRDRNPDVAWRAAVGLANLRDTTVRSALIAAVRSEKRDTVRDAAAFALGVLGPNPSAAAALVDEARMHGSFELYRALGRAVPGEQVEAVCEPLSRNERDLRQHAKPIAAMLVELGLRQISSPSIGKLVEALAESDDADVRWRAAYVFSRSKDSTEVMAHLPALRTLLGDQGSEYARMFAASSIGRIANPESIRVLESSLRSEPAWRVRVNLFNALARSPRLDSTFVVAVQRAVDDARDEDPISINLATSALRSLQQVILAGKFTSADSGKLGSWLAEYNGTMPEHNDVPKLVQATASVLAAQLLMPNSRIGIENFAQMKDYVLRNLAVEGAAFVKDTFYFGGILASMPVSTPKEQLNRLEALASLWDLAKKDTVFMGQLERVKLARIYRHLVIHIPEVVSEPEVVIPALSAWSDSTVLNTDALRAEALQQLPKYLLEYVNGDHRDQLVAAVTALAAVQGDTAGFALALKTVGEFAARTSDREVLDSLQRAFAAHGLAWPGWKPAPRVSNINWKEVESLPNSLVVNFTRETIEIELLPYYAPLTTLRMVGLARIQYFANQPFHRVVPNFVIQSGDPTGSGWGGPGFMMRTEISPLAYDEAGVLGMASSGLNTEGSQWFITECPTPHLSTRYTVWGRVRKGMEKVFRVTLGEKLETIQPFDRK